MIDSTYRELVDGLPSGLRAPARGLLFELGLARAPGLGWAAVFQLPPSRDLPLFALSGSTALSERELAPWRRAHHAACFHHVLVDRMADRQVPTTPERQHLADHFLRFWRHRLDEARGGPPAAGEEPIARGLRAWRLGVGLEQAALARRALRLARYGRSILLKLGWAALASEELLHQRGGPSQRAHFRLAFGLLAVGMQCVDDAEDSAEDAAVHGVGLPAALGFSPAALFGAGALLTRAAGAAAARGRLTPFADWLSQRTLELEGIRARRLLPLDNLAALVIASSLEAVCLSVAGPIPGGTVDTSSCASSR